MAISKNQKYNKGKKGSKKKVTDSYARKEWYVVKAPSMFAVRNVGNTIVSKTSGLKTSEASLKNRVFEVNLADLQTYDGAGFRKIKLIAEDVQGRNVLTDFYGMDITRDYSCSLVRKWHSIIEGTADVKTTDGYVLRMKCITFTKRSPGFVRARCYAQKSKVRAIRNIMIRIMEEEGSKCDVKEVVKKLIPGAISKQIEKAASRIYPVEYTCISSVKVIRKPKTDIARLHELHAETAHDSAAAAGEAPEARNLLTAEVEA